MIETLNDSQLVDKLSDILQTYPLYVEFQYTGAPNVNRLPQHINRVCGQCGKSQRWQPTTTSNADKGSAVARTYRCQNCRTTEVSFLVRWIGPDAHGMFSFTKVGQTPKLEEEVSPKLEKALDAEDLRFYKKALKCRNDGDGLAALAYMRRVAHNRIDDLLDVLHETARDHGLAADVLSRIKQAKAAGVRFSDKVDYAAELFPDTLSVAGHANPVLILHQLASDGVHSLPEDECILIFDECKNVFEYVFATLSPEVKDSEEFKKNVQKLAQLNSQKRASKSAAQS
jgi:hypothetical protein